MTHQASHEDARRADFQQFPCNVHQYIASWVDFNFSSILPLNNFAKLARLLSACFGCLVRLSHSRVTRFKKVAIPTSLGFHSQQKKRWDENAMGQTRLTGGVFTCTFRRVRGGHFLQRESCDPTRPRYEVPFVWSDPRFCTRGSRSYFRDNLVLRSVRGAVFSLVQPGHLWKVNLQNTYQTIIAIFFYAHQLQLD